MAYHSFEDLEVWKRAKDLAVGICRQSSEWRDYALRDQIRRSAVSVPSNIAEGAERNSVPEFKQFLGYAKGSSAELRTQLYIAHDIGYLENDLANQLIDECKTISAMIYKLSASLKK
jgi:four helix bundle protein